MKLASVLAGLCLLVIPPVFAPVRAQTLEADIDDPRIDDAQAHHLLRVRRLRDGERRGSDRQGGKGLARAKTERH